MHTLTIQPETIFQALSDATRIRIIRLMIMSGKEVCLCEITDSLKESQTKLSRHLKVLRQSGLLFAKKEGRWIYHRLATDQSHFQHLHDIIKDLPDIDNIYTTDLLNFQARECLREDGRCQTDEMNQIKEKSVSN